MNQDLEAILRAANLISENSIKSAEWANRVPSPSREELLTSLVFQTNRIIQMLNLMLQIMVVDEPTQKEEVIFRPKL